MAWRWMTFDGFMSHACPEELAAHLERDAVARGATLISSVTVEQPHYFDLPGMCAVDRPLSTHEVDGLRLEIPDEDVASMIGYLDRLKIRYFADPSPAGDRRADARGAPYYKMHGFNQCLVLAPPQRLSLLAAWRDDVSRAEASATAFWAGRKLPSEVLREAAAKANEIPLAEVPDLGGHKQDRFRLKKGGDA